MLFCQIDLSVLIFIRLIEFAKTHTTELIYAIPDLFVEYTKHHEINMSDFAKKIFELEKQGVIGELLPGEFVKIDDSDRVFTVLRATLEGFELEEITAKELEEKKLEEREAIIIKYKDIKPYKEDKKWQDISYLKENNIFVMHVVDAFQGGAARIEGVTYNDPILNIIRNIERQGEYTLSASAVSEKYSTNIFPLGSMGVLMDSGQIYAAYPYDASTKAISETYRISLAKPFPVELAIKTNPKEINPQFSEYNELLIKNWKVGGIFYMKNKISDEEKRTLQEVSQRYNIPLYEYDFPTKKLKKIK